MDPSNVDKLAKDKNGVKHLVVPQDLFDTTIDPERMETTDSKETIRTFLTVIRTMNRPEKNWLIKEQNLLDSFWRLCTAERIYLFLYNGWDCDCRKYNTCWKLFSYHYVEHYRWKNLQLLQFVTTLNFRGFCWINLRLKIRTFFNSLHPTVNGKKETPYLKKKTEFTCPGKV